jgi:FKBP-type peptidyl-prolyl cis-trans isomerase
LKAHADRSPWRAGGFAILWFALSISISGGGLPAHADDTPTTTAIPAPADVAAPPPDALVTASGVAMTILKAGEGQERPGANDCVKVHFTGWKRDGSFLASSRLGGEPDSQCLKTMFRGVADALQTMVAGEERRLWVPADLTYKMDDLDEPPPGADVTFDLELLEIQKAPETPRDLTAPRSARKTPSGLALQMLHKGRGTRHPASDSRMTLHFSGWTADGRLIESSVMGGQPATYEMEGVLPGWREALPRMVVGDKVRLFIPASLAFGEKARRGTPRGDVVYELELLQLR